MVTAERRTTTPEAFLEKARDLLAIVRSGGGPNSYADSVRACPEIGEKVLEILPNGTKNGQEAYNKIGASLGHTGSWVFRMRYFALAYSKKEMETLLRRAALARGHAAIEGPCSSHS